MMEKKISQEMDERLLYGCVAEKYTDERPSGWVRRKEALRMTLSRRVRWILRGERIDEGMRTQGGSWERRNAFRVSCAEGEGRVHSANGRG